MRSIVVWLIGILLLPGWMGHLYAQMPEPTPTVTLDMRQVPLLDILMELEKQTGLFFSYESSLLKELPEVSLSVRDESLSYCLKRLFSPLPIIYRVTGQYIILKRKPRQYTISGFVRDSASYESLLGASVLVKSSRGGTMSNNYGFYSLILPPGKVRLRASYVGFKAMEIEIDLQRDTMIDFPLRSLASLGEVVIRGTRPRYEILSSRTGVIDVPAERVKSMPALLAYQKEYYERTASEARKEAVQGYVFDTRGSKSVAFHFLENMARHHIEVYQLAKDYQAAGNKEFQKGSAYVIPVAQKYSTMVKVLMEDCLEYTDSTFYDISTWTFPYAFNLECAPVKSVAGLMGDRIERNDFPQGRLIGGESRVGYVFENREFYAPKVVYELQRKGIRVSATNRPFQFKNEEGEWTMGYGTYQVLTHNQPLPSDVLYATLGELAKNTGVDIYSANTGLMADVDFGSPAFKPLEQPKVAMLVGRGVSIPESGEIWFLLDKRFQMRPVLIENPSLTGKDLKAYNVIILANGVPNLTKGTETALKEWVAAGGVLIATGKASAWASKQGLISLKTKETLLEKADSLSVYRSFADKAEAKAGKLIKGVILNCHLDKTHPLAWGLDQDEIAVIKTNDIIFQKDRDPYVSPLYYTKKPLLSGFLSADNANLLREEPAIMVKPYRSGKVIVFADDMNFRSYFFGTSKLFMNALFYNKCM